MPKTWTIPYRYIMSFEEIYNALYVSKDRVLYEKAAEELAAMSNPDWSDWIDYRNDRNTNKG